MVTWQLSSASTVLPACCIFSLVSLFKVDVKAANLFLVIESSVSPKIANTCCLFFLLIAFAAIVAEDTSATHTLLQ